MVKELVSRGFNVIAIARDRSGIKGKNSKEETLNQLNRANVCFSDVDPFGFFGEIFGKLRCFY